MPPTPNRPASARRRALELLADCGEGGCTEAIMLAHGFTMAVLATLVRDGLVSVEAQRVHASARRTVEVQRLRITDAGRQAIGDTWPRPRS